MITPEHQKWCFEIHPELSFRAWNGNQVIEHGKHSVAGRSARESLIDKQWFGARDAVHEDLEMQGIRSKEFAHDDINDALAALWTAERISQNIAKRIPDVPEVDSRGLRIEMWY